jgi:serine/threonine protein phosphatase PrpC
MEIRAWGATDAGGVRSVNEDAFLIRADLGLYAVADGMGGPEAGPVASRLALETVVGHLYSHREVLRRASEDRTKALELLPPMVDASFQNASTRVYNQASVSALPTGRTMATTLSMLLLAGPRGVIGHVGDSRIYLLRDGQIYLITEDHNHLTVLVKNGLDPRNAARVPNARALTRAVGPHARVEVETLSFVPLPEDVFLLCTDGLHGLLTRDEIAQILLATDLETAPERFIAMAKGRGAPDNVTAVVVQVREPSEVTSAVQREARMEMQVLAKLELFGNLEYLDILELLGRFGERHVDAGEVIFKEGSVGDELYVIVEGRVEIRAQKRLLRILEAGLHFGEFAMIDRQPRSATVTAIEPTHLLVLSQEQFERLKREDPARALAFYEVIAKRLSLNLREADQVLLKKV